MVFVILLGASVFSLVFRGLGGDEIVEAVLAEMPGGAFGAMFVVMALMFFMGFFLDFIEIIFVVVPIVGPVLLTMGLDPIWLGVMIAVNLQTSFLTPRSEEHTSELQSLMRISYAVFCLKKKTAQQLHCKKSAKYTRHT